MINPFFFCIFLFCNIIGSLKINKEALLGQVMISLSVILLGLYINQF